MSAGYSAQYMSAASAVGKDGGPVPTGMPYDGYDPNVWWRRAFRAVFPCCFRPVRLPPTQPSREMPRAPAGGSVPTQ